MEEKPAQKTPARAERPLFVMRDSLLDEQYEGAAFRKSVFLGMYHLLMVLQMAYLIVMSIVPSRPVTRSSGSCMASSRRICEISRGFSDSFTWSSSYSSGSPSRRSCNKCEVTPKIAHTESSASSEGVGSPRESHAVSSRCWTPRSSPSSSTFVATPSTPLRI